MNKSIVLILFTFIPLWGITQENTEILTRKERRKGRPTYIDFSAGLNFSKFRDFATSPLIYTGIANHLSLSRSKFDSFRESNIGYSYSFGKYFAAFNNHAYISLVDIYSVFYSQLYKINKVSSEKWNIKVGGLINTSGNIRVNNALQNNALGIEIISTLMGSIKVTKDFSRKEIKNKKILFIKYTLKPRKRNLAFRFNFGLLNSSFRNGYTYIGQSSIINKPNIFYNYQYHFLSGIRMNSTFNYTFFLKNKNALQFSYLWDAYKTGGNTDKLEMAHHIIIITFFFNTNNK